MSKHQLILTRDQKKILISVLYGTQNLDVSEGGRAYVVFQRDYMPGLQGLVAHGYLLERPNPSKMGAKMSYALTDKGAAEAMKVPVTDEVKTQRQPMREVNGAEMWAHFTDAELARQHSILSAQLSNSDADKTDVEVQLEAIEAEFEKRK